MGTLLVNERMLESYVIARDHFLNPNGKCSPSLEGNQSLTILFKTAYKLEKLMRLLLVFEGREGISRLLL